MAMPKYIGASPFPLPSIGNGSQDKSPLADSHVRPIRRACSSSPCSSLSSSKLNESGPPKKTPTRLTLPMLVLNALDAFTNKHIDSPPQPSMDPERVLHDNFAPVDELPPTECELIQGSLPPCLHGAYIRNGPNPQHVILGRPYHLFDGDGMLHAITISNGKATLCSRYVKTYKYNMERRAGAPIIPSVLCGFNGPIVSITRIALLIARILAGHYNPANGIGVANTSLAFFRNNLYALGESDLPYAVRVTPNGDIETLGRETFGGKLVTSMTAHPKQITETGEVFAFRTTRVYPFITYFRFDSNGDKQPDVPIRTFGPPPFIHDFSITRKFALFIDPQISINPLKMILGRGSAISYDLGKVSKLGVIPCYAKDDSEMKWFDLPGFNSVHVINAWDEEDDAIIILASNALQVHHSLERTELSHMLMEKVRLELKTGIITRHPVSTRNLEFGVINPAYVGRKNRFVYAALGDPMPSVSGVVKIDVSKGKNEECTVATRMYGPRCYGGEPFFVARDPDNPDSAEDDGYLVSYVHDEVTGESRFLVMDAQSQELNVVAAVKLPRQVPYGFHGLFVKESDLKKL